MGANHILQAIGAQKGAHGVVVEDVGGAALGIEEVHVRAVGRTGGHLLQASRLEKVRPLHRIVPQHLPDPGRRPVGLRQDVRRQGVNGWQVEQAGGNAAVGGKEGAADDGADGQSIADVVDQVPQLEAGRPAVLEGELLLEAVLLLRQAVLVIAAQQEDSAAIEQLGDGQVEEALEAPLAAVDVVAQEEVVGGQVRRRAQDAPFNAEQVLVGGGK